MRTILTSGTKATSQDINEIKSEFKPEKISNINLAPFGGLAGQVLTKKSDADGDIIWTDKINVRNITYDWQNKSDAMAANSVDFYNAIKQMINSQRFTVPGCYMGYFNMINALNNNGYTGMYWASIPILINENEPREYTSHIFAAAQGVIMYLWKQPDGWYLSTFNTVQK